MVASQRRWRCLVEGARLGSAIGQGGFGLGRQRLSAAGLVLDRRGLRWQGGGGLGGGHGGSGSLLTARGRDRGSMIVGVRDLGFFSAPPLRSLVSDPASWRGGAVEGDGRLGCEGAARGWRLAGIRRRWIGRGAGSVGELAREVGWACSVAGPDSGPMGYGQIWVWSLGRALIWLLFLILFFCLVWKINSFTGMGRVCPGKCTQRAVSTLMRRRVPCCVKWSQPLSSRMKFSVTGIFQRQHSGKADRHKYLWFCMNLVFPVCHQICKANRVATVATFANRCFVECIGYVETAGFFSESFYTSGFWFYVPPLYSAISLIVTV